MLKPLSICNTFVLYVSTTTSHRLIFTIIFYSVSSKLFNNAQNEQPHTAQLNRWNNECRQGIGSAKKLSLRLLSSHHNQILVRYTCVRRHEKNLTPLQFRQQRVYLVSIINRNKEYSMLMHYYVCVVVCNLSHFYGRSHALFYGT